MSNRKRRAPGASPRIQQQPPLQRAAYPPEPAPMSTENFSNNWNAADLEADMAAAFSGDANFYDYTGNLGAGGQSNHNRIVSLEGLDDTTPNVLDSNSGQLVRRNPNQQLAARRRTAWDAFDSPEQSNEWNQAEDDDADLEQKALLAKKDRKAIPPFVQKLSSFLDDNKNTNLIRWSDDGSSFIVLDEDEFARTLIPELFKHNNYASFVRQLNMYGFHKKVGLSDNSMKASELKAKAPSEYFNRYFKRGRAELLWLIQKPKNPASAPKRKREDDGKQGDSDDERKYVQDAGGGGAYGEDLAVRGSQEMAMIPRTEYNSLRGEVRALQQQQKVISNVLGTIRRQNDQLYQQATAFQTLHERHENSINAILTFLATFYNRSLEGNSGANLADLFGPAIPQQQQQQQQPHGNVVDVEEYPDKAYDKPPQMPQMPQMQMQRQKMRNLLLPAPAPKDALSKGDRAATLSPSALSSGSGASSMNKPMNRQPVFRTPTNQARHPGPAAFSTPINSHPSPIRPKVESPPTPQPLHPLPENEAVMSAIQNVNANTPPSTTQGPQFDLPAALANFQAQGGNIPLTPQQRNEVLNIMANNASAASPNSALAQNPNNAMVNPQPPAMPDLSHFLETQNQLEALQRMSEEQNSRVQSLQERLQPLSPSGSIPGLSENGYFGSAGANLGEPGQYDLNLDSFINNEDYFAPQNGQTEHHHGAGGMEAGLPDLNFDMPDANVHDNVLHGMNGVADFASGDVNKDLLGFDGVQDEQGGRVESLSSSATSPAVTVEDAEDDDDERARKSPKRRRK